MRYFHNKAISTLRKKQGLVTVCLVIPTYNEAGNIKRLLDLIYSKHSKEQYGQKNIIMNVLVVDDSSPDGTADIVRQYQKHNPNVYILSRSEKQGLGAAYIAGLSYAIGLLRPDILFEMDADLSHDPKYILPMIQKVRDGADFVVGSRYIKGGSVPDNWGIRRVLTSRLANAYARTLLGIRDVHDCTGGFRAIRTDALEEIDLRALNTKGYAFQISLLEQMRMHNFVIKEHPIQFVDRTNGKSKMRLKDILGVGSFVLLESLSKRTSPAISTSDGRVLATVSGNPTITVTRKSSNKPAMQEQMHGMRALNEGKGSRIQDTISEKSENEVSMES